MMTSTMHEVVYDIYWECATCKDSGAAFSETLITNHPWHSVQDAIAFYFTQHANPHAHAISVSHIIVSRLERMAQPVVIGKPDPNRHTLFGGYEVYGGPDRR